MRDSMADLSSKGDWLGLADRPGHLDLVAQVGDVRPIWELVALVKAQFESMIQLPLDAYYLL